ncbi:MAG: hypothetical protein EA377_04175 [Phycisphaerales bacterium]|nr:MAG: hypothetical protein EA377_04175 [Phycisphaerales bacterium]
MIARALKIRLLVLITITFALCTDADAQQVSENDAATRLSGQLELARLVDLAAERLNLNIEYDASQLRGQVTLRLGAAVTDQELWILTNRVLASRGFATVANPGENVVSVVRLQDAPGMAAVEDAPPLEGHLASQYVTVIVRIEHRSPARLLDAIKPLLSRTGSQISVVGDTNLLMISDLRTRVAQVKQLLRTLDREVEPPVIENIPTRHMPASALAALVSSTVQARESIIGVAKKGKVTPSPDGTAVILIAPPSEYEFWIELINRFDVREAVTTTIYASNNFAVSEIARLIEQSARTPGPRGSGDLWRLVEDDLTSTLIVTATPSEHRRIEDLFDRLDAVPTDAQRPVRAFPIRNRSVREMTDVLRQLIDAGVIDASSSVVEAPGQNRETTRPEGARWVGSVGPADDAQAIGAADPADESPSTTGRTGRAATPRTGLQMTADEGTNTIIAIGEPRKLAQLEQLIEQLDLRQPQVMLEVLVLTLSESQTFDLGVELQKLEVRGSTMLRLASIFGLGPSGLVTMTETPSPAQGFTGVALSPGDFSVLVRALESINDGRSINIPKVLVNNNQVATLDSVREEPFTSLNALDTVATTSFGGSLAAGTVVTVTPQIAEADHLMLEYSVSLSSFVGESADPTLPPPRQQDRLQSQVTIPDGFTVALGGLEVESEGEGISQLPILGGIPLLGEIFKTRSRTRSRSRFFVFIRANVLRNDGFEDLRYLSEKDALNAGVLEEIADWPEVSPRIIR